MSEDLDNLIDGFLKSKDGVSPNNHSVTQLRKFLKH